MNKPVQASLLEGRGGTAPKSSGAMTPTGAPSLSYGSLSSAPAFTHTLAPCRLIHSSPEGKRPELPSLRICLSGAATKSLPPPLSLISTWGFLSGSVRQKSRNATDTVCFPPGSCRPQRILWTYDPPLQKPLGSQGD